MGGVETRATPFTRMVVVAVVGVVIVNVVSVAVVVVRSNLMLISCFLLSRNGSC